MAAGKKESLRQKGFGVQTQKTDIWTQWGKESGVNWEISNGIYALLCVEQIVSGYNPTHQQITGLKFFWEIGRASCRERV